MASFYAATTRKLRTRRRASHASGKASIVTPGSSDIAPASAWFAAGSGGAGMAKIARSEYNVMAMSNTSNERLDGSDVLAQRYARRKIVVIAFAIAFLLTWQFWFSLAWMAMPDFQDLVYGRPFESTAWKSEPADSTSRRLDMVDDLLKRHLLEGMSELEVISLLGEPTTRSDPRGFDVGFSYILGIDRHQIGADYALLVVGIRNGKVAEVWRSKR